MAKSWKIFFCTAMLASTGAMGQTQAKPACFGIRDLASPDGEVVAHFSRSGRFACGESKVDILQADGHLLLNADYSSPDGDRGSGLVQAAWSADSRYLVLSLVDEGERGPWVYRMDIYRRDGNKLRSLAALAPDLKITQPAISFGEGDILEVGTDKGVAQIHLGAR